MNWLDMQMALLDATASLAGFAFNWLLQSTLLIAAGLLVGRLVARRGSAAQSVVYRATLVAVLVCPLATWMLTLGGMSGWSLEMPAAWSIVETIETAAAPQDFAEPAPTIPDHPPQQPSAVVDEIAFADEDPLRRADSFETASGDPAFVQPAPTAESALPAEEAVTVANQPPAPEPAAVAAPIVTRTFSVHPFGIAALVTATLWVLLSLGLLTRLAWAWWQLARLRRSAVPADAVLVGTCQELANHLGVITPDVLRSPYLPSPCLAGIRRPAVLLPDAELCMSVRDVLIHELAHLRRRDCQWNLLRRLATAVFFFQPLLWHLSRRIEATAEEVCDDFVVELGGDRHAYAHRLVDIAELSQAPAAAAGVGIVSLRSMLAQRVARIMDTSRSLSTRVGSLLLTLVLVGALCGTAVVGLVGVGERPLLAEAGERDASKKPNDNVESTSDNPSANGGEAVESQINEAADPIVDQDSLVISGRLLDRAGQPVAGADVAVIGIRMVPAAKGRLSPTPEVLAEGQSDNDGQFSFTLTDVSNATYSRAHLLARTAGTGLAWQLLDLDAGDAEISLTLEPEEVIRGRIVDVDGQPGVGVRLEVDFVMPTRDPVNWKLAVGYKSDDAPAAWPMPIITNAQGEFAVHGLPAGHGVWLELTESEQFSPQDIALNTGMPEQRTERDATYRPVVKNVKPGEEALIVLPHAQWFEGVVRYEDTGEPVPGARVSIWASQQQYGSMSSVEGETNAEGRYRINPKPGIRFGVSAYPPAGSPYLIRRTPIDEAISWETGDRVKTVDITLPRGVLVRGTVVESGTSTPVAGASIQYIPEAANNPNVSDDIVTGWQGIQTSNDDGNFAIAVLPGAGRLLVHGPGGEYVLRMIGDREMSLGKPGGERNYAHAIERIDVEAGEGPLDMTIEIERGKTISGRLVDEQGEPVDEVHVVTRLNIHPFWIAWQAQSLPTRGGRFELGGLEPNLEYPTYFLASKQLLGATAVLRASDESPTIVLKPCGQAKARFVNGDGEPLANFYGLLRIVVTPGPDKSNYAALRDSELAADSDFEVNIDESRRSHACVADADGRITYQALIPGATYRYVGRNRSVLKEFTVEPGEEIDLGELTINISR